MASRSSIASSPFSLSAFKFFIKRCYKHRHDFGSAYLACRVSKCSWYVPSLEATHIGFDPVESSTIGKPTFALIASNKILVDPCHFARFTCNEPYRHLLLVIPSNFSHDSSQSLQDTHIHLHHRC